MMKKYMTGVRSTPDEYAQLKVVYENGISNARLIFKESYICVSLDKKTMYENVLPVGVYPLMEEVSIK